MADHATSPQMAGEEVSNSASHESQDSSSQPPRQSLTRQSTSSEPRKCWICFGDSNEDIPGATSPWRTPCPCALTAHEACLLDWIADLEAPPSNPSSQTRPRKDKIQCPQCKTEIRVARPWSPVVAGVRAVERVAGTLVVPGIASLLVGGVFSACFVHGAVSVFLVLGPEEWERLIGTVDGRMARAGFRLILGLPMVPIVLVLSRTKAADGLIPMLPFIFLAPQLGAQVNWNRLAEGAGTGAGITGNIRLSYQTPQLWPPTPAAAFAVLPYLRAVYNAGYQHLFAAKEKEWIKAVQREPRQGETEEQINDRPAANEGDLEIQAEIIFNDDGDDDRDPEEVQAALDDAFEQAREDREQAEAGGNDNGNVNAAGQAQRPQGQVQGRRQQRQQANNGLIVSASRIADTVLGALCFPAIASIMGEVLKLGLPARMTAATPVRRPGILHTKWGRSIVGGCLFVVVKDALVLYSRYRLAHDHKKRRVLDYSGRRVRSSGP